ncbi:chlorophyll synthase ChlG [Aurantiacibacter spongiae]|uniref:Chlorophyll synthase ChlG n=1 Tax=Aurantiacibacter spongiae TaxID=2488860 RepID=A0A3N5CTY3_9SPHN|nr:chlorophyll synthase ChlG [Aurantiacibacter spongiae]RPF71776.1 chlorophyll synthase ChlG [Aurantiacibacter spongiae]
MVSARLPAIAAPPRFSAVLELVKPVTWFAPVWALACGSVAGWQPGQPYPWAFVLGGLVLAGPLVCGGTQAANDWYDRYVDAINEPARPIPSGRVPGRWGLGVATALSLVALTFAGLLGGGVLLATAAGLALGWAYSAPPLRLKREGWTGAAATGLAYEGLAWLTGAMIAGGTGALAEPLMVPFALFYSFGALGIMVLNDFKAVEGDLSTGVRSLPARYGEAKAARIACLVMIAPQVAVSASLFWFAQPMAGAAIAALMAGQLLAMRRLLRDPRAHAPWYNAVGVLMYVAGMMIAAVAVHHGMSA